MRPPPQLARTWTRLPNGCAEWFAPPSRRRPPRIAVRANGARRSRRPEVRSLLLCLRLRARLQRPQLHRPMWPGERRRHHLLRRRPVRWCLARPRRLRLLRARCGQARQHLLRRCLLLRCLLLRCPVVRRYLALRRPSRAIHRDLRSRDPVRLSPARLDRNRQYRRPWCLALWCRPLAPARRRRLQPRGRLRARLLRLRLLRPSMPRAGRYPLRKCPRPDAASRSPRAHPETVVRLVDRSRALARALRSLRFTPPSAAGGGAC
jgi:hypothetical protein